MGCDGAYFELLNDICKETIGNRQLHIERSNNIFNISRENLSVPFKLTFDIYVIIAIQHNASYSEYCQQLSFHTSAKRAGTGFK